jgi:hypothetical protein
MTKFLVIMMINQQSDQLQEVQFVQILIKNLFIRVLINNISLFFFLNKSLYN